MLTVESDPTSKRKDFGRIGFHQVHGGTYLVFPRALPKETDSRIVGMNYRPAEDRELVATIRPTVCVTWSRRSRDQ